MTKGFYTIIDMPYDGISIQSHSTKREAERAYNEDQQKVKLDTNGEVTDDSELQGTALVRIETIKEKGKWYF